jgi:hypothetical protein
MLDWSWMPQTWNRLPESIKQKIKKRKSIFDEPELMSISKTEFLNKLKNIVGSGGEISWLTTDTKSFDWAEINADTKRFLRDLKKFKFETVSICVFYPKTKRTEYTSYKIINQKR